jgi:phospholipid/cholesterol/gamma-HCH transport system ATP-binding protein
MIEVKDVWKNFDDNQVLRGLSLTIKTSETIVILGRSGVGKSVLLKHIIGITKPDKGSIEVDGVDVTKLSGEKLSLVTMNMGMLFQGSALFDSMNIEENIAFYLNQHGDPATKKRYPKKEVKERVDYALEIVGLQGVQKKLPSDLSGGMKKRAALARLIVYRPAYLLYDEPTTGLDPITAMQINELIVKTQKELKATSVVVTHDIISALFVADRLALHKDGKIDYLANPDEFLKIEDPIIDFLRKTISQDPRTFRPRDYVESN